MNNNAFFLGTSNFLGRGGHPIALLQAAQGNGFRTKTLRGNCNIHRHIAAADNEHMIALLLVYPAVDIDQELKAKLRKLLAVKAEYRALPCTGRDEDLVVFLCQFADLQVLTQLRFLNKPDTHVFHRLNDSADVFLRQTEIRNGIHQAAARFFHCIIHSHGIAGIAQIIGCRQTRRTCANQRNLLAVFLFRCLVEGIRMRHDIVTYHTLHAVNRNGFIR